MSIGSIISVEDSDTDFLALQHALHAAGLNNPIERCESGRAAMDCLLAEDRILVDRASLIMLDLNLPGIDGRRLLREFRARDPERAVPVIVLSTSSHPRDIDDCYRAGADAYMVKPLELEDWETKVGQLAGSLLRPRDSMKDCGRVLARGTEGFDALSRTIENEIIPRLLLAHSIGGSTESEAPRASSYFIPGEEEVAELTRLLLSHDVAVASSYVETMREQGVSLGSVFLALLAPAAQLVGDWWREEQCDFTDVSLALSRLQHLLRDLNTPLQQETTH
jgi:CheY-like chemotaxis protein